LAPAQTLMLTPAPAPAQART